MSFGPADLRAIPLFQDLTDTHLAALTNAFQRVPIKVGDVLFESGDVPKHFVLLLAGEVSLREDGETRFKLRPIAPIGELGALTGIERNTTAVATEAGEVLRIDVADLMTFFEQNAQVAFPFYHNLLRVVADKIHRDTRRLTEMRANIIRTQKAMKNMRDLVLESEDSQISKQLFDTLEELIEHNRRWNYLMEPAHTLIAKVRLDNGSMVEVTEISAGWLRLSPKSASELSVGSNWSGVLIMPSGEIPVSGTVDIIDSRGATIRLDLLIREYASMLEDFLTRLQMLDFVV